VIRKSVLTLIGAVALAGVAWAQDGSRPEDVLNAAQSGDPAAQLQLGILYEYGFYLEDNKVPALAWYMLAAPHGNPKAAQRRDLLMARMSQANIEQARKLSAQLQGTGAGAQ
jgi:TPR repeat protein